MSTMPTEGRATADAGLRERAVRVIPGGMYGHLDAAPLPQKFPQFFSRGEGCRVWDADGNELIDFMCSWGPILLGHKHPEVEAAAARQAAAGDVLNGPTKDMVELAELLVDQVTHADWAMFAKNGTDATSLGVLIARAATGHRRVLVARGSYHGIADWSARVGAPGMTPESHLNTVFFEYNDLASVEAAVAQAGADDVAAIVLTPIRHDVYRDLEPAQTEFAHGVRAICDRIGAALLLDDIRCGLRLDLRGSWEVHGVRPDLSAWSKSLANGHALAALLGADALREGARSVIATGSFWFASAPMAAALATIDALKAMDGIELMRVSGERFQEGLARSAQSHGLSVTVSGPPQMPFLSFEGDSDFSRASVWAGECAQRGVYLHPFHNWFLNTAHDTAAIDEALERVDGAFGAIRERYGTD